MSLIRGYFGSLLPSWLTAGALAVALLSGWWALHQHDARVAADALAEQRGQEAAQAVQRAERDSIAADSARAVLGALRASLDSTRRADSVKVAAAGRTVVRAREAAAQAGADLRQTLAVLRERVTPELVPVADTAQLQFAEHQAQDELVEQATAAQMLGLRGMLQTADSTVALLESQVSDEHRAAVSARDALARQTELAEFYRRQAHPGFLRRAWRALPYALGGVAVGVVGWELAR